MRNASGKSCRENQNTFYASQLFSFFFFFLSFFSSPKIVSLFEVWKNIVEPGRPQMTIWRVRIACWIPKATNTHSQYVTHCFSTVTVVARTRLNVTLYVHYLSCLDSYPDRSESRMSVDSSSLNFLPHTRNKTDCNYKE